MRFIPAISLCLGLGLAPVISQMAAAETVSPPTGETMNAADFDAYVEGKTLTWSQYGSVFGIEEYLPGRKVRWKTSPDECQYGSWYERAGMICFVYEYSSGEHCWTFWNENGQLRALSEGALPGSELTEVDQTPEPLACPAPDVGV
ncbi:hypothetical protein [Pseudogemmobacter bohemicus]|uniref:hypothetical protein n=1 Tax=Pseudogemmobacter bohemicus TaxID=2250708 RepID=UPI001E2CDC50|nr:hypothetical protein [Pseudogemmobacter bohemicus]